MNFRTDGGVMKTRPIIFSGSMVRAILNGDKTQTRRVVKPQPEAMPCWWRKLSWGTERHFKRGAIQHCPYGAPGDRLWVRETWARGWTYGGDFPVVVYEATGDSLIGSPEIGLVYDEFYRCRPTKNTKWHPSIHMPRCASRITLEITAVRVERLQEISEADAIAEGVTVPDVARGRMENKHRNWFSILWDSIYASGDYPWESNPWVWVIEFQKVKTEA